jgi:hypothetical protein
MGYDLHITRASAWYDSETEPISAEEWLADVALDPELTVDADNGPTDVLWVTKNGDVLSPFWWWEGSITTKNPDPATIAKMLEIARRLDARVFGDDDEEYRSPITG